jgi:hypothetical protein
MEAKMNNYQEKMEAAIVSGQEKMRAVISSIWGELKESMKYRVEAILVSLNHRTQGTQAKIGATKTLIDTMRRGLKAKIAEVTDNFLETLETSRREFKMLLVEVEAWGVSKFSEYPVTDAQAKQGSCQRTGTRADP